MFMSDILDDLLHYYPDSCRSPFVFSYNEGTLKSVSEFGKLICIFPAGLLKFPTT